MNNWILPHIQEEIAELEKSMQQKEVKKVQREKLEKPVNYVILDAALWDSDIDMAFKFCPLYTSLFSAKGAEYELDAVAPYLFPYSENTDFSRWLKTKEKTGLRALYMSSDETLEGLRKHLRRFLRAKTEEGKYLFFRIYDPYVINTVMPNLYNEQYIELFEKINFFITEDIRIAERRIFYYHIINGLIINTETVCG